MNHNQCPLGNPARSDVLEERVLPNYVREGGKLTMLDGFLGRSEYEDDAAMLDPPGEHVELRDEACVHLPWSSGYDYRAGTRRPVVHLPFPGVVRQGGFGGAQPRGHH